ncbi:restriction endonuclease subunit S [Sphingopyxis terrae]|uniref:Type I restriction enzyme, S subunit n=1 Tax=Sphingopyxis terrae subsp. ummariensis TaxID=429001 RepID=A0A1Y6E9B9_9SPHN|nr:restriction endonuclease subunit S [Sphingopyxis terrae]PCF92715.1 restriction endonuclease subunit S [Sphingopyxis terrae subsp. ummariensis]SMQ57831.1 type I restriction enzyme, S subunit [Sphingopyxis terrae subsp. ummariensis]
MSFPAYSSYRDSGVEWLGDVPSHWDALKVKGFAQFSGGGTPNREKPEYWNGDIPWVSPKDMKQEVITSSEEQITVEGLASSATSKIEPGAVLLVVRSGILRHTIPVAINEVTVALNQDMKALQLNPSFCEPRFLFRWVQGLNDQLLLAWSKQGATVESIEHQYLAETLVPLPSLPEQTAITAFLDRETAKIDALVEQQRRLIELLKEKRQAVISHAVTKGLDPTVPMKDSGVEWLGEVPAHWAVKPLKYLAAFRSGGTPSKDNRDFWNGEVPWASAKDLKRDFLIDTVDHLTRTAIEQGAATLVPAGSVLVLVRGMMLARTFPVCEAGVPMTINQDLKALLPASGVNGSYLAWLLRGTATETLNRLDEAGHGTKALRMEAWVSMELPMPAEDEQGVIVAHLERAVGAIDALCDQATAATLLLQERRTALISAAVTGKIDVRNSDLERAEAA